VSKSAHNRIEILHGVNLNTLGRRNPDVYGTFTLAELETQISRWAAELEVRTTFFQTNHEGEFCEYLHKLPDLADAAVINAGAWTHYSWAIRDAAEVAGLPFVEVHISDVSSREDWRAASIFDGLALEKISGEGAEGYRRALELLKGELGV
jgi:3-dehydroquinate dehydratase II